MLAAFVKNCAKMLCPGSCVCWLTMNVGVFFLCSSHSALFCRARRGKKVNYFVFKRSRTIFRSRFPPRLGTVCKRVVVMWIQCPNDTHENTRCHPALLWSLIESETAPSCNLISHAFSLDEEKTSSQPKNHSHNFIFRIQTIHKSKGALRTVSGFSGSSRCVRSRASQRES
jgi:hypothetical protein